MGMRSPTVQDSDLSARAKIREAALRLFGSSGFGVSLRTIAMAAGVSPGLVIHHFGSKDGLRSAVDESVLSVFLERFDSLPKDLPADVLSRAMAKVFSDVLGPSPDIRQYLRRCLLDETPAGTTIFDEMVAATQRGLLLLERAGGIRADSDPEWRPFQVLAVVLGPLLLEPVMQRHIGEPAYAPDVVRRRTAANLDVLSRGLFSEAADARAEPTP